MPRLRALELITCSYGPRVLNWDQLLREVAVGRTDLEHLSLKACMELNHLSVNTMTQFERLFSIEMPGPYGRNARGPGKGTRTFEPDYLNRVYLNLVLSAP